MKITKVKTYLFGAVESPDGWASGNSFLFVKIESDNRLSGWGEAYAIEHRERAIEELIISLGNALIALPDATPRSFRQHIAFQMADYHPGIDFSAAVSALETALWDLLGKKLGAPVHQLLGGALVDRVPLYANTWGERTSSIEALAERCKGLKDRGFRGVKIYPMIFKPLAESVRCVRELSV